MHKGELDQFQRSFLEHTATTMRPVFANTVFVVWEARGARISDLLRSVFLGAEVPVSG